MKFHSPARFPASCKRLFASMKSKRTWGVAILTIFPERPYKGPEHLNPIPPSRETS